MIVDKLYIGPCPNNEECPQIGDADYGVVAPFQCLVFVEQLERCFGRPPSGASYYIPVTDHDSGRYWEVVLYYHPDDGVQEQYAMIVDAGVPARWDGQSVVRLAAGPMSNDDAIRYRP